MRSQLVQGKTESDQKWLINTIAADAEKEDNELEQKRNQGKKVLYGHTVQVELQAENAKHAQFRIMPRYKVKAEGDVVQVDDQIVLESAKSPGQFLHVSRVLLGQQSVYSQSHELNLSVRQSGFTLYRKYKPSADDGTKIRVGDPLRFYHKEMEAYLVAEGLFDDELTEDGGILKWEQQCRIVHMCTRRYLAVSKKGDVSLSDDNSDPSTVFRLHPVIRIAAIQEKQYDDAFTLQHVEPELVEICHYMAGMVPFIQKLVSDSLKEMEDYMIDNSVPSKNRQKLMRNLRIVELLVSLLRVPYLGSADQMHLTNIFVEAYNVLYTYLMGNSRKNELYIAKYIDFFLTQFEYKAGKIGLNAAHMVMELIRDNRKIVDRISHDHINKFVELLQREKNYRYLELLSVLCVCDGVSIADNQRYITQVWLMGGNKMTPRKKKAKKEKKHKKKKKKKDREEREKKDKEGGDVTTEEEGKQTEGEFTEDSERKGKEYETEAESSRKGETETDNEDYRTETERSGASWSIVEGRKESTGKRQKKESDPAAKEEKRKRKEERRERRKIRREEKAKRREEREREKSVEFLEVEFRDKSENDESSTPECDTLILRKLNCVYLTDLGDKIGKTNGVVYVSINNGKTWKELKEFAASGQNEFAINVITKELDYLTWTEAFTCLCDTTLPDRLRAKYCELIITLFVDIGDNVSVVDRVKLSYIYDDIDTSEDKVDRSASHTYQYFPALRDWIALFLGTNGDMTASQIGNNMLVEQVLRLVHYLVKYGFYYKSTDIKMLLEPLMSLLDGRNDKPYPNMAGKEAEEVLQYFRSQGRFHKSQETKAIVDAKVQFLPMDLSHYNYDEMVRKSMQLLNRYYTAYRTLFTRAVQAQVLITEHSVEVSMKLDTVLPALRRLATAKLTTQQAEELSNILDQLI
nr:hypothetical protein BaRGS_000460 [Batillaria attramentaria]